MPWYDYRRSFLRRRFPRQRRSAFRARHLRQQIPDAVRQPPGVGKSSAIVNVLWGWFNFVVGLALLRYFFPPLPPPPGGWPRPRSARWSFRFGLPAISAKCATAHRGREGERSWPEPADPHRTNGDPRSIAFYHAHVYYDPKTTRNRAERLRQRVGAEFPQTKLGRWHDELVGTAHAVDVSDRVSRDGAGIIPALADAQSGRAVILLHPETGNDYRDHTAHAAWFGAVLPLRLEAFQKS